MTDPADAESGSSTEAPSTERRRTTVILALSVGSVIGLLILLLALSPTQGGSRVYTSVLEEVAPVTVGQTAAHGEFDLRDLRGQWALVNFFATWCTGCVVEHPELVEWNERHKAAGDATVVSVVYEDGAEAVETFFAERGGDWPVIIDDDGSISLSYGVTGVPESYLVAPSGRVVAKFIGASGVVADNLDATIAELSGEPAE